MKKLVPILMVIALLVSMAVAEEEKATYQMYVLCDPESYINARMAPNSNASVEGLLDCGDVIETDGVYKYDKRGRKWIHIVSPTFESESSWVCSMYLQETPVVTGEFDGYVSANGRTALRRAPGGTRVRWLKNGDEISIIAMSDDWVLTKRGYIRRDCLDVSGE